MWPSLAGQRLWQSAGRVTPAMCLYWGSSGRNVSAWSTAWTRPSPPHRTMNMTGRDEKQGGGRCMASEHGQGARKSTVCNTVFVSCGRWSTAKYLKNKYTKTCPQTYTHLVLLTGINLNKNDSETRSWTLLLKLWSQQSVTEALPEHRKKGKYRFPRQSSSLFSLSEHV